MLRAFIPAANPDFEQFYGDVVKWWIELDAKGSPERELGFNERGAVVVAGPLGKNFGFFTDSDVVFEPADYLSIEAASFEAAWMEFEIRWAERPKRELDHRIPADERS